ncbi:hypothetical protein OS493_001399 [Desmophyllum pertusum]|uniref:NADP-dependent oxidoreductase domain-containing protein n=1 Tax=Desmophyllum pertusum TaxID=174260 RepID=A0A9X0CZK0_9CNID|nr:hypothetical protein OS493_001399 [Desmophyllum pertusum]
MSNLPASYVEGFHYVESVQKMKYQPLGRTGMAVSKLSFGASSLGSVFRETNNLESIQVVHHAIKSGINYIDVAPWYGHGKAETVLGQSCVTHYVIFQRCQTVTSTGPAVCQLSLSLKNSSK